MLELPGRIGLGVDVADLLHLQAALQADGVVQAAPDEEGVLRRGKLRRKPRDALLVLEQALHLLGQRGQGFEELRLARRVDLPADARKEDGKQVADDELRGVCLRRGHGDLRPGERVEDAVRLARDGRAHDVDDGQRAVSLALGLAQRGQAVRGLARLAHDDDELVLLQEQPAVAELRSELRPNGQPRQVLEDVLRRDADVVRRSAGDHADAADAARGLLVQARGGEVDAAVLLDVGMDRVAHGLGLLVDLLHHEVLKACLFRGLGVPLDMRPLLLDPLAVDVVELRAVLGEAGDLQVADVIDVARVLEQRRDVGGEERLPFARADDHGAVLARGEDLLWVVRKEHGQRVGAADAHHAAGECVDGAALILLVVVVHELDGDLGIRLGLEAIAVLLQLLAQLLMVLDDAVVHRDNRHVVAAVRVRVALRGLAVRGPARVADAAGALERAAAVDLLG